MSNPDRSIEDLPFWLIGDEFNLDPGDDDAWNTMLETLNELVEGTPSENEQPNPSPEMTHAPDGDDDDDDAMEDDVIKEFSWERILSKSFPTQPTENDTKGLECNARSKKNVNFWGGSGKPIGSGGNGNAPNGGNNSNKSGYSNLMFSDCGGLDKQIAYLQNAVIKSLNRSRNVGNRFGLKPPKGILFYGAPGTGKTRLALALSNEISKTLGKPVHFIFRKGSDVASKFFGQSSAKLREIFDEAKRKKPTLLFFDELDGLCPNRDKPFINEANVTIVTTLLGLLDEIPNGEVFIVGATNRLDSIDPALKRPGRFDKYLEFLPPNEKGRQDIISIHTKKWHFKPPSSFLQWLGQETHGFTGADLAKLCLDAFDQALMKKINVEERKRYYKDMNLSDFRVTEEDWKAALGKIKPSSEAFAFQMFSPLKGFGESHVLSLVKKDVQNVTEKLLKQMKASFGIIQGLYIWRKLPKSVNSLVSLEDLVISPMFKTTKDRTLADMPKYVLSMEILCSTPVKEWNQKISNIFGQAVASNVPCLLIIPQVDTFPDVITSARATTAVNMKTQLERLRGTKVILLATGNRSPLNMHWNNPFKSLFEGDRNIQVADGSKIRQETRKGYFLPLFENPEEYKDILNAILEATKGREPGSLVSLYDEISQVLNAFHDQRGSLVEERRALFNVISSYWRNTAGGDDSDDENEE